MSDPSAVSTNARQTVQIEPQQGVVGTGAEQVSLRDNLEQVASLVYTAVAGTTPSGTDQSGGQSLALTLAIDQLIAEMSETLTSTNTPPERSIDEMVEELVAYLRANRLDLGLLDGVEEMSGGE